jgi:uncharacterized protein YjbI with pentapeptide repeats
LWRYRRPEQNPERFKAALSAAALWLFSNVRRTSTVLGFGVASIVATLLAFEANRLFWEQNKKFDLQNHLIIVQSNLEDARRNIEIEKELPSVLSDADDSGILSCPGRTEVFQGNCRDSLPAVSVKAHCLSEHLNRRVEAYSHLLQPYRLVIGDQKLSDLGDQEALWKKLLVWLNGGTTEPLLREMNVPQLSQLRLSPERGALMRFLLVEKRINRAFSARRQGITFDGAYLPRGSSLVAVDLVNAWLRGADLTGVDLDHTMANNAHFEKATLKETNLRCAMLIGARFDDASLQDATLTWSTLRAATMRRADLRRARLVGADLTEAKLHFANLRGADLSEAHGLDKSQIAWACLDSSSRLPPIEGFSIDTYQQRPGCLQLWDAVIDEWIALKDRKPCVGIRVQVKIEGRRESPEIFHAIWDGASFSAEASGLQTAGLRGVVYWKYIKGKEPPGECAQEP